MSSLNRAINLTNFSLKKGIIITWVLTLLFDLVTVLVNLFFTDTSIGLVTGSGQTEQLSIVAINILPFIIFFITNSMIIFSESLPISISYGLTRKNFFIAMILNSLIISVIFAAVQGILFKMEPFIIDILGKTPRDNFVAFNLASDNVFFVIAILFLMIFAFISIVNLLVGLNSKYGFKIWLIFIALFLILVLAKRGLNINFGISEYIDFLIYGKSRRHILVILGSSAIISNLINYIIIRTSDIKYEIKRV